MSKNKSKAFLPSWHCDICGKNFQTGNILRMHMLREHDKMLHRGKLI